jgi:three-Cys-motif partner protein
MPDENSLPLDEVGTWALEKHDRLRKYIDISRGARSKFIPPVGTGGASYVDLYCGSGRSRIRESGIIIDGSPLVAFKSACDGGAPFTEIHLADAESDRRRAAALRLASEGGSAIQHDGDALEAAESVARRLSRTGLHFTFLDPYNLQDLPFAVFQTLGRFRRMDFLIHVSAQDLQRNLDDYTREGDTRLNSFAPGWRETVDLKQSQKAVRAKLLEHWLNKIRQLQLSPARGIELVSGGRNQRLYWLVFVSRSDFATGLWEKIRTVSGQGQLF